jgi:N-acyl-D-amino-acid deacylase
MKQSNEITRRSALGWMVAGISTGVAGRVFATETPAPVAMNPLQVFDDRIAALMKKYEIPGGAVAIAKDDRLVYAQGFGHADAERMTPVRPEMLFRIASVSKPVTAVAILRLVDQGKLSLDECVFERLSQFDFDAVAELDERLRTITIRQLLEHSGGWDRDASFDPMFRAIEAAEELGEPAPAGPETVIRYMLKRKLDFDPGTKESYSNFGYCLLGRVIETVTGQPYETAVQELALAPAGVSRMKLGKTRLADRAADEVWYDEETVGELATSVFPDEKEPVSWCYGGFYLEAMDAHGGWLASPVDLVRFATAVDGRRGEAILSDAALSEMTARPSYAKDSDAQPYVGLCWNFSEQDGERNWWHTGSLPGTAALLVRAYNGLTWAAVFNDRPGGNDGRRGFHKELDALFWEASAEVTSWPEGDRFGEFA